MAEITVRMAWTWRCHTATEKLPMLDWGLVIKTLKNDSCAGLSITFWAGGRWCPAAGAEEQPSQRWVMSGLPHATSSCMLEFTPHHPRRLWLPRRLGSTSPKPRERDRERVCTPRCLDFKCHRYTPSIRSCSFFPTLLTDRHKYVNSFQKHSKFFRACDNPTIRDKLVGFCTV